jgi:hypothetical protein
MKDYRLWFWQLKSLPSLSQISKQICNISLPWMTNLNSAFQTYTTHHVSLFLQNTPLMNILSCIFLIPLNTHCQPTLCQTCLAALSKQPFYISEAFCSLYLNCPNIFTCHQHIAAFVLLLHFFNQRMCYTYQYTTKILKTATSHTHCNVSVRTGRVSFKEVFKRYKVDNNKMS